MGFVSFMQPYILIKLQNMCFQKMLTVLKYAISNTLQYFIACWITI